MLYIWLKVLFINFLLKLVFLFCFGVELVKEIVVLIFIFFDILWLVLFKKEICLNELFGVLLLVYL